MATQIEVPEQVYAPTAATQPNEAAVAAAGMLDGATQDISPKEEITVRLTRHVDDPVNGFKAEIGQTFSAYVDAEGTTWVPYQTAVGNAVEICLEAEEFEIVEAIGEQQQVSNTKQLETGKCAQEAPGDRPTATSLPPTELATSPVASVNATQQETEAVRTWEKMLAVLAGEIANNGMEILRDEEAIDGAKKDISEREERHGELVAEYRRTYEGGPSIRVNATRRPAANDAGETVATWTGPGPNPVDGTTTAAAPTETTYAEAQSQADYETLLRGVKLSDLSLTRDNKKVSLKGSVEKLAEAGIVTVWDWEDLRAKAGTGKAEYPKRLRRDDLEEAVATWVAAQRLPRPQTEIDAMAKAPESTVPVEQQQSARDARVVAVLQSQSIDALAGQMTDAELAAVKKYGCKTLADFEWGYENRKVMGPFSLADAGRVLAAWKREHLDWLIEASIDQERAGEVKGEAAPFVGTVAEPEPTTAQQVAPAATLPANVVSDLDEL